jgi:hypothetical protein
MKQNVEEKMRSKIKLIRGKWKKRFKKKNGEWHEKTSYTFETYWNM